MDNQRLGIANVGKMRKNTQGLDKAPPGGAITLEVEAEHGTATFGQQFFRQFVIRVSREFRIRD